MNVQRLLWAAQRTYLRHGAIAVVVVLAAVATAALAAMIAWTSLRVAAIDADIAQGMAALRATPARAEAPRAKVQALPLPAMAQRFAINQRVLAVLRDAGLEPERVRFRFEPLPEAGLTRQVTAFTLKARWPEIAAVLARLQAAERALYIARLRLVREHVDDEQMSAEIQLAVALVDAPGAAATPQAQP